MRPIHVRVTDEMIAVAIQRNRNKCAAVLGIKFADDDLEHIQVDDTWIRASSRSEQVRYWWPTPPQVRRHVDQFDLDRTKVKPFTFTIDPRQATKVKPVRRQGAATMAKRHSRPRSSGTGRSTAVRVPTAALAEP